MYPERLFVSSQVGEFARKAHGKCFMRRMSSNRQVRESTLNRIHRKKAIISGMPFPEH